ncbi:MAG: amidohydrolase family protein [Anaerolineales bacterium]|nr:amidohydrolase family protein [Anaerolineales bacterium]
MTTEFDILIRAARLRAQPDKLFQIGIRDGKVAVMAETLDGRGEVEIDAGGGLVTESFVNPHLHLCKVYTLQMMDEIALQDYHGEGMGKAMTAIEQAARIKEQYDAGWIIENVRKALALAAVYGNTHIRAFADVDSKAKLEGIKALLQAKEEFKGVVDVQVVAFAQDGIVREPGTANLLVEAMQMGADVAGGIPWIEYTEADIVEHVQVVFETAERFDADVSMLVDDAGDPGLRSLEVMAVEAIQRGWQGRALAHHARAQSMYPTPYLQKVAALLKQAQMGVVTDPHTGPLHARVSELLEEGVLVCLGQDDISDAYYPFGRNNMLEVAFLASHLLWMTTAAERETLYDMITTRPAKAMNVADFGLAEGAVANLVVLHEDNVVDALRYHHAPAAVVSHGKLVDVKKYRRMANLP